MWVRVLHSPFTSHRNTQTHTHRYVCSSSETDIAETTWKFTARFHVVSARDGTGTSYQPVRSGLTSTGTGRQKSGPVPSLVSAISFPVKSLTFHSPTETLRPNSGSPTDYYFYIINSISTITFDLLHR